MPTTFPDLTAQQRAELSDQLGSASDKVTAIEAELAAGSPATKIRLAALVRALLKVASAGYLLDPASARSGEALDAALDRLPQVVAAGGRVTPGEQLRYMVMAQLRSHPVLPVIVDFGSEVIDVSPRTAASSSAAVTAALLPVLQGAGAEEKVATALDAVAADGDAPVGWLRSAAAHLVLAAAVLSGESGAVEVALLALVDVHEAGAVPVVDLVATGLVVSAIERGIEVSDLPQPLIALGLRR